jgi:hypothetical protein
VTLASVSPPLRFVSPGGWPQPSPSWVARNQGWQPPEGWLPPLAAGWPAVAPAPRGWEFWAPEPGAWAQFREPYRKAAKRQILVGSLLFGIGSFVTLLGYIGALGGTVLILWGMIVFGFIRILSGLANLRRADRAARQALVARSFQVRRDQDTAIYPQYLAETAAERAATGRPAMSLEQLSASLDAAPWGWAAAAAPVASVAGYSPASPWTPPEVAQRSETSIRRRFWIPLAALGGILVVIVLFASISDLTRPSSSGAGSAPVSSTGRHWPADAGNYGVSGVTYTIADDSACAASAEGCFPVTITAPRSCGAATITWGFSDSGNGDDKAVRTSTVALTAGQQTHVDIPIDSQLSTLGYMFLDGIECR